VFITKKIEEWVGLTKKGAMDSVIYFVGVFLRGVAGRGFLVVAEEPKDSCLEGNLIV
jgi:hypothetical protein